MCQNAVGSLTIERRKMSGKKNICGIIIQTGHGLSLSFPLTLYFFSSPYI